MLRCLLDTYDQEYQVWQSEIDRIRQIIEQQHVQFVQVIDQEKKHLLAQIEDYLRSIGSKYVR